MKKGGEDMLGLLVQRAKARREADRQWMLFFDELAHYFFPNRKGFTFERRDGEELTDDIWCSQPERARKRLARNLVSTMVPKDRMWVGLKPANIMLSEIPEIKAWCEIASKMVYAVLYDPRVNFVERMNEIADDASTFGTFVARMTRNIQEKHLELCVEWLRDFSFETDGSGKITTQYAWKLWPISRLVREFGLEALPEELQEEWRQPNANTEKRHEVLHICMPNDEYRRFGLGPNRLPYKSIWILTCFTEKPLDDKGGYYVPPYVVGRWYRTSQEAWGRSDAMTALPDARLAQSVAAALLEITEKQGNPPMQGPIDILRGEIELFPGGFTPFDLSGFQFQGDPLRPVQIGANPALTSEYLEYLERKLDQHFYNDVLATPEPDGKSTMEDNIAWNQRIAQVLGPIFSRIENELLPPILDWVFDQLLRLGEFPPMPEALVGQRLEYHYDNYIADMRDAAEAQRALNSIGTTAQFERPEQDENLDWDIALRETWTKMKVPTHWIRPMEDVEASREQRQQMEQAMQMAEIAKSAGPGLKAGIDAAQAAQGGGTIAPPAGA
jgi:hypothetical protein